MGLTGAEAGYVSNADAVALNFASAGFLRGGPTRIENSVIVVYNANRAGP